MPPLFGLEGAIIEVTIREIFASVAVYLGIPFATGILSRRILLPFKGTGWFDRVFLPRIFPVTLVALLFTIVVMFSTQGERILAQPLDVLWIAAPLSTYFITSPMVFATVVGPLVEVPVLINLVHVSLSLRRRLYPDP